MQQTGSNWNLETYRFFISTTHKPKFLEYRRIFLLYGIEVIRFRLLMMRKLLKHFFLNSIARNSRQSLYYLIRAIYTNWLVFLPLWKTLKAIDFNIVAEEWRQLHELLRPHCYFTRPRTKTRIHLEIVFKTVERVEGVIKTENNNISPFAKVFGWDSIFYVKGLNMSYHGLRELGFKNSARDRVLSSFLRNHIFITRRLVTWNSIRSRLKRSISVSI